MKYLTVIILAKDEAGRIGRLLSSLQRQDVMSDTDRQIDILVVPNGCSDATADVARLAGEWTSSANHLDFQVINLEQGGKSRSWNRAVHEFASDKTEVFLFLDADIELLDERVISNMLSTLESNAEISVAAGNPIKSHVLRADRSMLQRFSAAASKETAYTDAICGQCYLARADDLTKIWLPLDTPGEDGFLNAMITTEGFTTDRPHRNVKQMLAPTHSYEDETVMSFLMHERRLLVGTMINRWVFEYLHAQNFQTHCGAWIKERNETNPSWVEDVIRTQTGQSRFLVAPSLLFRRMQRRNGQRLISYLKSLPVRSATTAASLIPAWLAHKELGRTGSSKLW